MIRRWRPIVALAVALLLVAFPAAADLAPKTNCSGTITTGGTAQVLLPRDSLNNRHGVQIQNLSTGSLGISEFTAAPGIGAAGTWTIAAAATFTYNPFTFYVPRNAISIIGATTAQAFACVEW
jgi:hypothetical protein